MSREKQIETTDWLTSGMTDEEIAREKEEALADIVEVVRCRIVPLQKKEVQVVSIAR